MAKRTPPKHSQFKKGVSGNPGGRPRMPDHLKQISKLTKDEVNATFSKYVRMTFDEMEEAVLKKDLPALEVWIASSISRGIRDGDLHTLTSMMDRFIGKPKPEESPKLPPPEVETHVEHKDDSGIETYVVMMNKNGKFESARPRLINPKSES